MTVSRSALRRRRAALPASEIAERSLAIARHLWRLPCLARSLRIAAYLAVGGEVDCTAAVGEAVARGRRVYLPVLHGNGLVFAPWVPGGPLMANRFGIPEPAGGSEGRLRGPQLDVVLTPLLAFDDAGNRLGMGGGFYDRTFAFLRHRGAWRRPRLIGVGYEFQRVAGLPARSWDVRLHAAVTENGAVLFDR